MSFYSRKVAGILFMTGLVIAPAIQAEEPMPVLKQQLQELGVSSSAVRATPVKGLWELQVGSQIYYISADGKYLLAGNIIDLKTRKNLTEGRLKAVRAGAIKAVSNSMIRYKASKPVHEITVFTDIACAYCRKLHSEMAQYNDAGITVNYLFYPPAGPGSPSYQDAISVWCNKDRNTAMTRAKAGEKLPAVTCDNPVAEHFLLGNEMGVNGTPAIVTEHGDMMPGYVPPQRLKRHLDLLKQAAAKSS